MAAEELLERSPETTPEIRTQIFALVERATQQGIGEKYNLRPKAHRILAHLHERSGDADKAEANRAQYLESADGPMLLKDAQDRLAALGENIERDTAAPILDLLTKAVEKLPPDRRNLQAEAYRATAEVLEAIGEKARAVEYYECALQMNPKIAVTKRLEHLKKQLAAG
jgi:tetratricopeptide (TPR) repeat protein